MAKSKRASSGFGWVVFAVIAGLPLWRFVGLFRWILGGEVLGAITVYGARLVVVTGPFIFLWNAVSNAQNAAGQTREPTQEQVAAAVGAASSAHIDPAVALARVYSDAAPSDRSDLPGIAFLKAFYVTLTTIGTLLFIAAAAAFLWWVNSPASDCFLGC